MLATLHHSQRHCSYLSADLNKERKVNSLNLDRLLGTLQGSRVKRSVGDALSGALPSVSAFLIDLVRNIYSQLAGASPDLAGRFISSLLPKTPLSRTVVSKNIKESLDRRSWDEVVPTLLAVQKRLQVSDLQGADQISNTTDQVVVKQVRQLLDQRTRTSTNVLASLFQALHSTMNSRLNGGFRGIEVQQNHSGFRVDISRVE